MTCYHQGLGFWVWATAMGLRGYDILSPGLGFRSLQWDFRGMRHYHDNWDPYKEKGSGIIEAP